MKILILLLVSLSCKAQAKIDSIYLMTPMGSNDTTGHFNFNEGNTFSLRPVENTVIEDIDSLIQAQSYLIEFYKSEAGRWQDMAQEWKELYYKAKLELEMKTENYSTNVKRNPQ